MQGQLTICLGIESAGEDGAPQERRPPASARWQSVSARWQPTPRFAIQVLRVTIQVLRVTSQFLRVTIALLGDRIALQQFAESAEQILAVVRAC